MLLCRYRGRWFVFNIQLVDQAELKLLYETFYKIMEKSKIVPVFYNQEKALWYLLTMNQLVKKAFQDFPEVGVEFVGSNHQQIDLQFFFFKKINCLWQN